MFPFALVLASCGAPVADTGETPCPEGPDRTLTVLAASSVSGLLTAVEPGFLADNDCVSDVVFSFGSSATLAGQVVNGVPADVFVSASRTTMDTVVDAGLAVGDPVLFARNIAAIMVSEDASGSIAGLADLAGDFVRTGLCVTSAPCGALADTVLARAGLDRDRVVDTEASSLEDLVTKIELGELDAGVVYASDCATPRETARCVTIPEGSNATTEYFAVGLTDSPATVAWLALMAGDDVRRRLTADFGFLAP